MHEHYDGLRSFLAECEKLGEVKVIRDADWNLEIGALTEMVSELIDEPPALMFDEIKGYPKGFRVLSIPTASRMRMASPMGRTKTLPSPMEPVRAAEAMRATIFSSHGANVLKSLCLRVSCQTPWARVVVRANSSTSAPGTLTAMSWTRRISRRLATAAASFSGGAASTRPRSSPRRGDGDAAATDCADSPPADPR